MDTPVTVNLTGLPAGAQTTVSATALDADGTAFSSSAQFTATSSGTVSLSQVPTGGSYTRVDPMGLFELLEAQPSAGRVFFRLPADGFTVRLTASVGGRAVATVTVKRQSPEALGVTEQELRPAHGGIFGDLYLPAHTAERHPGVLVFGGSEGGLSTDEIASLLAAHGYPALALAYFDEPGLPATLTEIPLEYFAKAANVLSRAPGVDPAHLVVWGTSRGSEAAELLGAYYPNLFHAVVASVPSSVIGPGLPDISKAAWTFGGKPLPAVSRADLGNPDPADAPDVVIPVEKIDGPIFLVCAGKDQLWPSCPYANAIVQRLDAHQSPYQHEELRYPTAGHGVGGLEPYVIGLTSVATDSGGDQLSMGDVSANEMARADAWPKLLAFLAAQ